MVKKIILISFIFIQAFCYGQYKNSVWCFGDSARIDFVGGVATAGGSAVNSRGSCASIADSANDVLFYFLYFQSLPPSGTLKFGAN